MAGKRKIYEQALREATNFAWDGQWQKAIDAYRRALAEFPREAEARASLAQACAAAGQWEPALNEYEELRALTPDDPMPLLRMADVLIQLKRNEAAGEKLMAAAGLQQKAGQPAEAAQTLERLVKLSPGHEGAREGLIALYQGLSKPNAAVEHLLALARAYQRQGKQEKAMGQVQRALQLAPRSPDARQMLDALRSGVAAVIRPKAGLSEPRGGPAGPVVAARQRALAELAELIFVGDETSAPPDEPAAVAQRRASEKAARARLHGLIGEGLDLQARGLADEAIASYAKALELGADWPALRLNLGLLYQERQRNASAVPHLEAAAGAPAYALGAQFALGELFRTQGQIGEALKRFIEVLKILDLQAARPDQSDDLIQLYETLADQYAAGDAQGKAIIFISSLEDFLGGDDWEAKVRGARARLDSLGQAGVSASLAEVLEAPDADAVLASMGRMEELAQQRRYLTAGEECYRAISLAPGYLPLHLRLADLLLAQERFDDAVATISMVAETYAARGNVHQAIGVYRQALNLAPMDVTVRGKLIALLTQAGETDAALEEYLALADTHYRMAQVEPAIESYNQALRLTGRGAGREAAEARIQHLLGDIYVQSVDWGRARKAYQRIVALNPNDTLARQRLIELSLKMGERQAGLTHLDELTRQLAGRGAGAEAAGFLHELSQTYVRDMEMQRRLALAAQTLGLPDERIAALNALGELQLDSARWDDAAETVRQLMTLEPDKAEEYRVLLGQILGRAGKGR